MHFGNPQRLQIVLYDCETRKCVYIGICLPVLALKITLDGGILSF